MKINRDMRNVGFKAGETPCYIERIEIGPPQLEALSQKRTG